MKHLLAFCAVAGALVLASARAHAHGLEPALLSLRELAPGRFEVMWKSSKLRLPGAEVRPVLPPGCRQTSDPPRAADDGDRLRLTWIVDCGPGGLAGQTVGVADLDVATIDALLRVEPLGGAVVQTVLTARQPTWTAPADRDGAEVLRHYARLGAAQMLASPDRLLLVFGLLLLVAPAPRRLWQAAVAFAVGHGATLALVAMGLIALPARAVELLLAGTVLLVAVDLVRGAGGGARVRRFAPAVALVLGGLSGAAFAGGFVAVGMPSADAPLALLAFNLGIAAAQVIVLAAAVTLGIVVARGLPRTHAVATRCAAYAMGILAVYWCLERLAA